MTTESPTSEALQDQARRLESLLPSIMRTVFTLAQSHPANELPVAQLRICALLQRGPSSMSSLSKELRTSVSAVTQMADRLEAVGMVERCSAPADRRSRSLRLTANGQDIMDSRHRVRVDRAALALSGMSGGDRQALLRLLQTFLEAGRATCPPHPDTEITRLQT